MESMSVCHVEFETWDGDPIVVCTTCDTVLRRESWMTDEEWASWVEQFLAVHNEARVS